ncbi:hypothetical protein PG997_009147 [Apiospora hydei]|uniref:Uncharacterized protein n=1 Tax=Apiospora hydei TaxID=1337664 RepID=A0ABR1VT94_9PEZI
MWQQVSNTPTSNLCPCCEGCVFPHPMYLAMLAYQGSPTRQTLERWDPIVTATADYMASYAWKNESSGYYDLGPPVRPYWQYGLRVAQYWKELLGRPIPEAWTTVSANLAPLPTTTNPETKQSYYAIYEGLNDSWWTDSDDAKSNLTSDPRSVIMLQGMLPDLPSSNDSKTDRDRVLVDPDTACATADRVWDVWRDERIRGWGRPVLAMNAARVGRADRAVYHLTAFDYWHFDDAGYAIRAEDDGVTPPPYLPANAGLLYAASSESELREYENERVLLTWVSQVGYMAAGWAGSEGDASGFPKDGSWVVKHEGMLKAL